LEGNIVERRRKICGRRVGEEMEEGKDVLDGCESGGNDRGGLIYDEEVGDERRNWRGWD
jgi:hypothetical protein